MMGGRFRNINWKGIAEAFVETIKSIGRGDILIRMRVDKLFPYILYTFFLAWISILLTYKSDQTMAKVTENSRIIEDLKISHAKKTCDIAGLSRITLIEEMLSESGSDLKAPQKPADRLTD